MTKLGAFFSAAAVAGTLLAAAPASAGVTFTFASWTQNLNSGYPVAYNATTKVLAGSGSAIMKFDSIAPLPVFNNLPAKFTFTAQAVGPVGTVGGVFAQNLAGGHLKFFTNSISNLLTIDFTGGVLWGTGNEWSIESANGISSIVFTSSVGSFAGFDPDLNAFSIDFDLRRAIRPRLGGALPAFTARFNGQALAGAVPEPATWSIMLTGFAGLGMALRQRRRRTIAFN